MRLPPSRSSIAPASLGARVRSAFTLVELLVVIGIIAILVALTLSVGGRVLAGGKAKQTAETIRVLDMALHAYKAERGEQIPYNIPATGGATPFCVPLCDGAAQPGGKQIPTTAWFIYYITTVDFVPSAVAALDNIDASFKRITLPQVPGGGGPPPPGALADKAPGKQVEILDGWKQPIRMVHPRFQGIMGPARAVGQAGGFTAMNEIAPLLGNPPSFRWGTNSLRRNFLSNADRAATPKIIGDSDGGRCVGDSPYFYSAGLDGDPSTLEDNVYTQRPTFEKP